MFGTSMIAPVVLAMSAASGSPQDWPAETCIASLFKAQYPGEYDRLVRPEYPRREDFPVLEGHFETAVAACAAFWRWDGRQTYAARGLFWNNGQTYYVTEDEPIFAGLDLAARTALNAKIAKHVAGYTDAEREAVLSGNELPSRAAKDRRFINATFSQALRADESFQASWQRTVLIPAMNQIYTRIIKDRSFVSYSVDDAYASM